MFQVGTSATWSVCHLATAICPTFKFSRNKAQINKRGTSPWGPSCCIVSSIFKDRGTCCGVQWMASESLQPSQVQIGSHGDTDYQPLMKRAWDTRSPLVLPRKLLKQPYCQRIHRENSPGLWIQQQSLVQQSLYWWIRDDVLTWSSIYSCYLLLLYFFCTNCNSTDSILRVFVEYFCYHRYDHQIFVVQLLSNPPQNLLLFVLQNVAQTSTDISDLSNPIPEFSQRTDKSVY